MLNRKPRGDAVLIQDLISEKYRVNLSTGIPNFVGSKVHYETNNVTHLGKFRGTPTLLNC